ncbi:flagellar filament capping protein FliD [Desulfofustis glycolicus]|uniref:Flagellar hook-associated protein 2 n=1 Tax=Desulfofustis glycolicus DSM 9705 TaxID=1121409 RepID=A0A1M5TZI8_9BACT|nr:flagellar filament capping protein FliD [Desulfofustis glycolicus]MCB2214739.1 flagellar filament capping protein FliD [Desulfobulbaceae bacterium]SHH56245.1 flagellar hook-associated protein 2 [Desulfofustis glycolicus DSM 9705]
MAIQFSGLASGMDTDSIVKQLMNLERAPITRMQGDQTWLSNKLTAYKDFDTKLKGLLDNVRTLASESQYNQYKATAASGDFFSTSASENALANTSYQVEVVSLAQVQKRYTAGFSSNTEQTFGTGELVFTVDGVDHAITIDETNNSLTGIMQAINDADIGVQSAIINDGSENPYRLTLTGDNVATAFTLDSSGLTGGSGQTLGALSESQAASQAHIRVDNIDIYGDNNAITDAIPGVTLDLIKAEVGTTTKVDITLSNDAIKTNINSFISAYNEVVSFVTGQSTFGDDTPGVLGGDSGLANIKRRLQNMLTTNIAAGAGVTSLSQLGLETQSDGQLSLDATRLSAAIDTDPDSLITLLAGNGDDIEGIGTMMQDYLSSLTSPTDGLLAGRKKSIETNLARIDKQITLTESRLEKREETLRMQFSAMEQLVSTMNSQSSFLSSQLQSLENLWNYKK